MARAHGQRCGKGDLQGARGQHRVHQRASAQQWVAAIQRVRTGLGARGAALARAGPQSEADDEFELRVCALRARK